MSQTIPFTKMVGAGNDFIVVDNRSGALKKNLKDLAHRLSDRKSSIGSDGLILLEKSVKADIGMRIFNPDGSEAEMCGNGVRCLAQYAAEKKITGKKPSVESIAGIITAEIKNGLVKVKMSPPKDLRLKFKIPFNGRQMELNFINTGVPHVVILSQSLEREDVFGLGRAIRHHKAFAPRGSNVNFVSLAKRNHLRVRTYERGVEGETLSCGTGCTASALVASALKGWKSPMVVETSGGDKLKIYFSYESGRFFDVYLEGPVKTSFEGRVKI